MSEEILNNTLQNKIINFTKKNTKKLIFLSVFLILILFSYFLHKNLQKKNEIKLSEQYIQATIQFQGKNINETRKLLEDIIKENHKFYSPLALYFIIDNNLETDNSKIINYFDRILLINSLDKESLNLIKIKKAISLSKYDNEEVILKTLNPIINSDSVWRDMAIRLISDYFLSKNQKAKANEYIQLLNNKIKK
jgi:predicted negative regulator of RcsB-dependent stress response